MSSAIPPCSAATGSSLPSSAPRQHVRDHYLGLWPASRHPAPYHNQARDRILGVRRGARELGKEVQVFTSGAVVCRPTQQEADEYFHYFAVEHRDEGAIDTMLNLYLSPANQRTMTRAEAEQLRARYGAGYGGLLAVGDPDRVAGALTHLADAGFDGFCFSLVAYNDGLPYVVQEVLPRLERLGLRQPLR